MKGSVVGHQNGEAVLIVGGGPFGLTLSIELSRREIASMLVDAKARTAVNPQASATQARTMEHYRRLGFANEIRALGLPKDYPTDIAYFTRYYGWRLNDFTQREGGVEAVVLGHRISVDDVRDSTEVLV